MTHRRHHSWASATHVGAANAKTFLGSQMKVNWSSSVSTRGDRGRRGAKNQSSLHPKQKTSSSKKKSTTEKKSSSHKGNWKWIASANITRRQKQRTGRVGKRRNNLKCRRVRHQSGRGGVGGGVGGGIHPGVVNRCEQWRLTVTRIGWLAREWARDDGTLARKRRSHSRSDCQPWEPGSFEYISIDHLHTSRAKRHPLPCE